MSTLHQLREGINGALDVLVEGWQRLYQQARGAIIRFRPGSKETEATAASEHELAVRSIGWGIMAAERA